MPGEHFSPPSRKQKDKTAAAPDARRKKKKGVRHRAGRPSNATDRRVVVLPRAEDDRAAHDVHLALAVGHPVVSALTARYLTDAINGHPHHGVTEIPCSLIKRESTLPSF